MAESTAAEQRYLGPFSKYGGLSKRAYYESLFIALRSERSSFDAHWQDLANHVMPRRLRMSATDRNRGDKRNQKILDNTATMALRTLQSGLHAGLTSPARPWFKLGTPDADLGKVPAVKRWLHEVTERMRTIFQQSNLYQGLPTLYGDLGLFGVGAMGILPDTKDLFRAHSFPIGSYVLSLDERGLPAVFIREFELTVHQVVERYGGEDGSPAVPGQPIDWSRISRSTRDLWERGQYESTVQMLWAVGPNPDHRPESPFARHFKYHTCHIERGVGGTTRNVQLAAGDDRWKVLRESGFRTFPVVAPRWDITGEDTYGTNSPGMTALPDVRQLQGMQRKADQALAKLVDPPLVGPTALKTQKTSLFAGDVTYVDTREGMQGLRPIHEIGINFEHLTMRIAQFQYRIQRAFYEDLFLMLAQTDPARGAQPVTAREIEERHEEKLLALGPVLERTNDELLDPLIDRTYSMMEDAGLIPEPPEELRNVRLKVEYVSIMAQAQKLVSVVGQDRFLQTVVTLGQGLAQSDPRVNAKLNINRFIDNYQDMLGVDPNAVLTDDEANEIVEQQQRQVAAAQAAAVAKDAAAAGKQLADTPTAEGRTALDDVREALVR